MKDTNQITITPQRMSDNSVVFDVLISQQKNIISIPAHDLTHAADIAEKLKEWTGLEIIDKTGYILLQLKCVD